MARIITESGGRSGGGASKVRELQGHIICRIDPERLQPPSGPADQQAIGTDRIDRDYKVGFSLFDRELMAFGLRTHPRPMISIRKGMTDGKSKRQ